MNNTIPVHRAIEIPVAERWLPPVRQRTVLGLAELLLKDRQSVNELLRESRALPQLIRHGGQPYHLHATSRDAPLDTRMAVEAAMAFADVVRGGELSRLRICEYPGCGNVVVDLSRNRSKRFCEAGCGNRAAVSAYRARKAATRP